jgi:pectate lyase
MKHRLSASIAQPLSLLVLFIAGCWSSAEVPSEVETTSGAGGTSGSSVTSGDANVTGTTGAAGAGLDGPVPYDPDGPLGWASVPGLGLNGTVGGEGANEVVVEDYNNFAAMVGSAGPAIVRVSGEISGPEISSGTQVTVKSDKTIIGEPGAVFRGNLTLNGVHNVIVQNLTIIGQNCTEDVLECSKGHDAITVKGSHHIWFDHLDVSDGSDGNLDITQASDYVTVSNSKFWYSDTSRNHRFSNLVGSSDTNPIDEGKLRVTFFRNWWADNVEQRMPRTRYGDIHILNNLYTSATSDYCINAGVQATLLVEGNVFLGVKDPHQVTSGQMLARDNYYDDDVEGARGNTGVGFEPPYEYPVESTDALAQSIRETAGPQ